MKNKEKSYIIIITVYLLCLTKVQYIHAALNTENKRNTLTKISFDSSDKFTVGNLLCWSHMTVTWLLFLMTDGSPEMASRRWQVTPSTAQTCTDCESQAETITKKRFAKKKKKSQLTFSLFVSLSLRFLKGNQQLTHINPNAFVGSSELVVL